MRARVYLATPLYRPKSTPEGAPRLESPEVTQILGELASKDGGVEIQVEGLWDHSGHPVTAPFGRVFVPLSKVDYWVIEAK
jgi:hypothetical protein